MPTPKPPYPAGFREQLVELAAAGRSLKQLAREFGVSVNSVRKWVQLARGTLPEAAVVGDSGRSAGTAALRQEVVELRRKLRQVQQERDILAKATAWFAGQSRVVVSERTSTTSTNS